MYVPLSRLQQMAKYSTHPSTPEPHYKFVTGTQIQKHLIMRSCCNEFISCSWTNIGIHNISVLYHKLFSNVTQFLKWQSSMTHLALLDKKRCSKKKTVLFITEYNYYNYKNFEPFIIIRRVGSALAARYCWWWHWRPRQCEFDNYSLFRNLVLISTKARDPPVDRSP